VSTASGDGIGVPTQDGVLNLQQGWQSAKFNVFGDSNPHGAGPFPSRTPEAGAKKHQEVGKVA
jgi:hypothetical protein